MNKIFLVVALLMLFTGCTQKPERNLLFKCVGIDQDHSELGDGKEFKEARNLYIGENYAEINGKKYQICSDNKTIINFATECNKDKNTIEFYDFFMANHHLAGKDFTHSSGLAKTWFSYYGDCEPVENKNSK
jgi:hypothetical protein